MRGQNRLPLEYYWVVPEEGIIVLNEQYREIELHQGTILKTLFVDTSVSMIHYILKVMCTGDNSLLHQSVILTFALFCNRVSLAKIGLNDKEPIYIVDNPKAVPLYRRSPNLYDLYKFDLPTLVQKSQKLSGDLIEYRVLWAPESMKIKPGSTVVVSGSKGLRGVRIR